MDNGLDLTLKLGLPCSTVETHLSLHTPTTDQGINVTDGGRRDNNNNGGVGERTNVDVYTKLYNDLLNHYAGTDETLNSYYVLPSPVTPMWSDYVDFSAQRYYSSLAIANDMHANAYMNRRRSGRGGGVRKCTNLHCNATSTPMWRRGPLGPHSLCNACGIKFRKEQGRRSRAN